MQFPEGLENTPFNSNLKDHVVRRNKLFMYKRGPVQNSNA